MAGGILGGLFGGSDDSSVMPGLLDQAGYMDPAEYDRRRRAESMQGLWAGLLQGSGPSLEPRNFFSALGGGLAASQKSGNEFDEAELRRAQGVSAYQKSALERDRLRLGYNVTQQYLRDQAPGAPAQPPGAPPAAPDTGAGGARAVASTTANADLPPEARGFLDTISGPESGGAYNVRYTPSGGATFEGYDQHPQIFEPGPQGPSSAAGRYQIVGTTWEGLKKQYGYQDFKPETQDTAAWQLAQDTYKRRTGGDLLIALQAGKLQDVQQALKGEWGTLNMGSYAANLRKYAASAGQLPEVPRYGADLERLPSETAIPGVITAGTPGPAPAPGATVAGATVIPDSALPAGSMPVPGHEYVRRPDGTVGIRATGESPARRGAALEQILSGQQTAQAGPPLRQLPQFAGPGAAGAATPAAPEAPAPGGITYGTGGMLGRMPPAAAAAAGAPAAAAPAPGGTLPGAAAAPAPGSPNTLFGVPLPVLPAAPAPPQVPAIPGLVAPGAPPALQPLAPVGAAPPVQLPPEQAARTRRAQGLALGLDLMGITVPKFIADEAGIEVAARSAAAQEAAKQPFAVQMERLRGDIAQQRAEFEAKSKLQQDEYATRRGFATDQFKSALGQLDDVVKQYTAAGLAGPVAGATAREQARFKNVEATILGPDGQPTTQRMTDLEFTQRREQQAARGSATPQPGDIVGMPAYTPGQEELSRGSSKDILTRRTMAQDAAQSIETNKEARALLDGGIFAGAGSNVETAVAKIGNALKLTGQTTKDTVANTEAYFSTVAQNVGRLIKQFGSGTGLSDADRQYAAAMAAGKQTLDEASIRKILDINDRAGTNVINSHNRSVAGVPQGVSLTPLTVELPTPYEKAPATAPRERFYNPRTGTFSP